MELLGREKELAAAAAAIAAVGEGAPRALAVMGEAGIGKSALLLAVQERAGGAGLLVLVRAARPSTSATSPSASSSTRSTTTSRPCTTGASRRSGRSSPRCCPARPRWSTATPRPPRPATRPSASATTARCGPCWP